MIRLIIALSFLTAPLLAQVSHVIDEFTNNGNYYAAFNSGTGSIQTSIINNVFSSGTGSLAANYYFNAGNYSTFTILRNYNTKTQDYSFLPHSFSLDVKHGNAAEDIAIRIWEDINMNGNFDGEDEVYISTYQTSSGSWSTLEFIISNFTKVTGNGNNTLDLNRIRAWDIAVQNQNGNAHGATLYFDKFSINSTYTPPTSGKTQLTGSFIQLWNTSGCNCGNWTQQQWDLELQNMADLCLNKFIIQYGIYHDFSWYTPSNLSFVNYESDALNKIIIAAEKVGIDVYFGLYFDETWNGSNKSTNTEYDNLLTKHQGVIDEIYNLFGASNSFGGWYIPQELNDLEWQGTTEQNLLFNWLKAVSDYANAKDNTKPVMIAPFFNLWQPADVIENWYDEMLSTAPNIKEIYPQDGVGVKVKDVNYHIPHYFSSIKAACDKNNRSFGATIESFEQLTGWPIDNGSFSAQSTEINQLKKQLWEAGLHAPSDIIQFSWSYMQSGTTNSAANLALEYANYANCSPTSTSSSIKSEEFIQKGRIIQFSERKSEIIILDLNGRIIENKQNTISLNLNNLSTGIYFIKATDNQTIKIVLH